MSEMKSLKFSNIKLDEFSLAGEFEQLCNLCGFSGAEILPEVEFLNKREIKSLCLSIFCTSNECRNLAYHYFELDENRKSSATVEEFTALPKGIKLTCNQCGNQKIAVDISLGQSGFKFIEDLVDVTISCSCGNRAKHQFLGKYF